MGAATRKAKCPTLKMDVHSLVFGDRRTLDHLLAMKHSQLLREGCSLP